MRHEQRHDRDSLPQFVGIASLGKAIEMRIGKEKTCQISNGKRHYACFACLALCVGWYHGTLGKAGGEVKNRVKKALLASRYTFSCLQDQFL